MVNHEDSTYKLKSIVQKGKVLWSGINGFDLIGNETVEWKEVIIFQFRNTTDFENSVNLLREESFKKIQMYVIEPESKIKLAIIHFIMKKILSRSKMEVLKEERELDSLLNSPILPKKEKILRLLAEEDGNPVIMLNLMEYLPNASYPPNFKGKHKKTETGKQAYNRYGRNAMKAVANLGGHLDYMGTVGKTLIGKDTGKWESIALMRYPTNTTFRKMFDFKGNDNEITYRDVGLKKTAVIALK